MSAICGDPEDASPDGTASSAGSQRCWRPEALACLLLMPRRRWALVVSPLVILMFLGLSRIGPAADELEAPSGTDLR